MTRNISKSHLIWRKFFLELAKVFFFCERSGEILNMYFCVNVHLLPEQLVAVTQKLDELWKLDNLLLLRLLLLRLPLPLPLPLPLLLLLLLLFLLLLWGVALPQNSTPQKAKVWRKFSSRLAKVHPATSDPQPIMSKFE